MPSIFRISEAASLAMHTMVYLDANRGQTASARKIAGKLSVSEAHLAKVLQRLTRAGYLKSTRGPKGGFILNADSNETTLLEIYELIEGPLPNNSCLFSSETCTGSDCIMGGFLEQMSSQLKDYLSETTISSYPNLYRRVTNGS
ncbi:MAG: Rrf2 family transcriptional regulator [bacterium]